MTPPCAVTTMTLVLAPNDFSLSRSVPRPSGRFTSSTAKSKDIAARSSLAPARLSTAVTSAPNRSRIAASRLRNSGSSSTTRTSRPEKFSSDIVSGVYVELLMGVGKLNVKRSSPPLHSWLGSPVGERRKFSGGFGGSDLTPPEPLADESDYFCGLAGAVCGQVPFWPRGPVPSRAPRRQPCPAPLPLPCP